MIDRRTALVCAALVALMLIAAGWRIVTLDDWLTMPIPHQAPLPALSLLFLPACGAVVAGALYWESISAKTEDDAKLRPWRRWGRDFSIGYCAALLLLQAVLISGSLGIAIPFGVAAVGRTAGILLAILSLVPLNRMPKLPWFERRFAPGGDLGPIYGPRYMRIQSRIVVLFVIAVIVCNLAEPASRQWRSVAITLLAAAFVVVQSIVWRRRLGRRWQLERMATSEAKL
jgi:hypothetical protein